MKKANYIAEAWLLTLGLLVSGNVSAYGVEHATSTAGQLGIIATETSVADGPNILRVEPRMVFRCPERDRITSTVEWSSADPALTMVDVRVQAPGEQAPKLFARGAREGWARTGNWVVEGTTFFMVNSMTGELLVAEKVTGKECR